MTRQGLNTLSNAERRAQLRARIQRGKLTIAPGVFEMISAKIAPSTGPASVERQLRGRPGPAL